LVYFQAWLKAPNLRGTFAIGLLLLAGAALRSHLLPIALLWPIIALILAKDRRLLWRKKGSFHYLCGQLFIFGFKHSATLLKL